MATLADEPTIIEETFTIPDSAVIIVQDRSSTLYLEQDPSFGLPIFLELSTAAEANDLSTLEQFQKRTAAVKQLEHPNIVPIVDTGITPDKKFYTAIEHFTSITLTQKLVELSRAKTQLSAEEALDIINQLADALGTLHVVDVVHQDLRTEKVLLNEFNKPFLAGFTVANSPVLTRTTIRDLVPVNELDYESPEQAMGEEVTPLSNVYSLGILLYELLAGHRPRLPIGQWQVDDNPQASREIPLHEARPGLTKETYAVVQKCIADMPSQRYQSMSDLQEGIHLALMAEQVNTDQKVVQVMSQQTKRTGGIPRWIIAAIIVLLVAAVVGASLLFQQEPPSTTTTNDSGAANSGEPIAAAVALEDPTPTPTTTPDFEATTVVVVEQQTATAEAEAMMLEATAEAEAALEEMIEPTATEEPAPTATAEPTAVPTEAPVCMPEATILVAYPHEDPEHDLTQTGIFFPLNFDLKNSGDCPIPAESQLVHVDGEAFEFDGEAPMLETDLAVNEARTLNVTLTSPTEAGAYSSTWQLVDGQGEPISSPFTFQVRTFAAENAAEGETEDEGEGANTVVVDTLALDWLFSVVDNGCEIVGDNWRCEVNITPYGGSGGPYQLYIFDQPANQATTLEGKGAITYHTVSPRCDVYSHELKIIDQITGNAITSQLTLDPNNYFDCS